MRAREHGKDGGRRSHKTMTRAEINSWALNQLRHPDAPTLDISQKNRCPASASGLDFRAGF